MLNHKPNKAPMVKMAKINSNKITNYFFSSQNVEADKKSIKLTQEIHNTSGDVFNGIGCFEGTFFLHFKPESKL